MTPNKLVVPLLYGRFTATHRGCSHTRKIASWKLGSQNRFGVGECRTPRTTGGGRGDGGVPCNVWFSRSITPSFLRRAAGHDFPSFTNVCVHLPDRCWRPARCLNELVQTPRQGVHAFTDEPTYSHER